MRTSDPPTDANALVYLQEKSLSSLQVAVELIDLAREPDTTPWYQRKLKEIGGALIGRLVPMVVFVHGVERQAAAWDEWKPLLDGGSFAFGAWCKKWDIADPMSVAFGAIVAPRSDAETEDRLAEIMREVTGGDDLEEEQRRFHVYGAMMTRLLYDGLPPGAQRLLLWLLRDLRFASCGDVVVVSRRYLPSDIGLSPAETKEACRTLYERGLIERVDQIGTDECTDALALRLVVEGMNDSRHPPAYRDEDFGFAGACMGGKPTIGNIKRVTLSESLAAAFQRWFSEGQGLNDLKESLQAGLVAERVFIQEIWAETRPSGLGIVVQCRYPPDEDEARLDQEITTAAESWLRERLTR